MSSSEDIYEECSPKKRILKQKIKVLKRAYKKQEKSLRSTRQRERRKSKKIRKLASVIRDLNSQNLISMEQLNLLNRLSGPVRDLMQRHVKKINGASVERQYPPELRKFALNLNFFSPKAYEFVRETFSKCLPSQRTISSWYSTIDCEPGFSTEAFRTLRDAVIASEDPLYLNLSCDEMCTREKVEWGINKRCWGYVDMGDGGESDEEANQVLVFMAVCINRSWKIPLGYFPIKHISSAQKTNLLIHCFNNVIETKAHVMGITFDGPPVNFAVASHLGVDFSQIDEPTTCKIDGYEWDVMINIDVCHNIKNVRNSWESVTKIIDDNNDEIDWSYLVKLVDLQECEQLRLSNKLTKAHIYFAKQKMKVKLAVQVISKYMFNIFLD